MISESILFVSTPKCMAIWYIADVLQFSRPSTLSRALTSIFQLPSCLFVTSLLKKSIPVSCLPWSSDDRVCGTYLTPQWAWVYMMTYGNSNCLFLQSFGIHTVVLVESCIVNSPLLTFKTRGLQEKCCNIILKIIV